MKQELLTILIAMTPTLEAHGAIIAGVGIFKFTVLKAFLLSILGTSIIIAPLLFFWHRLVEFFVHHIPLLKKFFNWLFNYTRARHAKHFEKWSELKPETAKERRIDFWKAFALFVFVAIPGPLTGIWAGSVAAYVFGIPFRHSFWALLLGALTVAAVDALIIGGVLTLF